MYANRIGRFKEKKGRSSMVKSSSLCLFTILLFGCGPLQDLSAEKQNSFQQPQYTDVFIRGTDGYHTYRIPSLIVTEKGTLLAFCEGRKKSGGDKGDIDMLVKRSEDGGKTWSKQKIIWDDADNTCGNPCPVVDNDTGIIWMPMTWNLGTDGGKNIINKTAQKTRRIFICYSKDDGKTFSDPVEITDSVKKKSWGWYATGPGVGIQLRYGPKKDRLVIPCDNSHDDPNGSVANGPYSYGSHLLYSDDHGKSWKISQNIKPGCNECQVVELVDGTLMMNMRNYKIRGTRAFAFSKDGGETFSDITFETPLIEPRCQASFLRYTTKDSGGKNRILFSNPASRTDRVNMTVRLSYDEGKTWPVAKLLHPGPSAYSCLTSLGDGNIACLYECGKDYRYEKIVFAKFSLQWLTNGTDKLP